MFFQLFYSIEFSFEFLFREKIVDLRMTRPANADDGPHGGAIKVPFVSLVMMSGSRNQMMTSDRLLAPADGACTNATCLFAHNRILHHQSFFTLS